MNKHLKRPYLSTIMTLAVTVIVLISLSIVLAVFIQMYRRSMEQSAVTSSEQAVVQVKNTVSSYTLDMSEMMNIVRMKIKADNKSISDYFNEILETRTDIADIAIYNGDGNMVLCSSKYYKVKEKISTNLSYFPDMASGGMKISSPHVVSLFENSYPWVVTISMPINDEYKTGVLLAMDIQFSNIAKYLDQVGIGQHGYCYIVDKNGEIIYHPQQQLINSGLKAEKSKELVEIPDGSYIKENVIYTIQGLENVDWRIVSVSYTDEVISSKVSEILHILSVILLAVLVASLFIGLLFSRIFTKPANKLADAMGDFEKNAEDFSFCKVDGTREITALSNSFGHMVVQIQKLMEKVRDEEISIRKTELNALQAQINPHFLYNTLDSIAWMCEAGRNKDAVEMTNSLARLFRISISKGYELIPIEKELAHAESYLKIQKFRYKNRFNYSIDAKPECLNYYCNKITLQPIIENCIVHGLDMADEGEIRISVRFVDSDIVFTVEDNGIGMTENMCKEIINSETTSKTGIGIKNVHDRIRIYFGEKYGLKITSVLDEGTRVEIKIPAVEKGEKYEK